MHSPFKPLPTGQRTEQLSEGAQLLEKTLVVVDLRTAIARLKLWSDLPADHLEWVILKMPPAKQELFRAAQVELSGLMPETDLADLVAMVVAEPATYADIRDMLPEEQQRQLWTVFTSEQRELIEENLPSESD